jgi:ABC-type transport system involved in cytochrome c biogenesis permease subunit
MMGWDVFIYFAVAAIIASAAGSVLSLLERRTSAVLCAVSASAVLAGFILLLWISFGRPPLRTMGETRLWYSFFAGIAGLFTYLRWRYKWILSFSTVLSTVFILLNVLKPEIHDHALMPALQSPWFIPHVTVYMFSYSLLGCTFLIGVVQLFRRNAPSSVNLMSAADTLVYIGVAFLTFGMLSGSIWAKAAWGHFWNWDPKETWALITWLVYLLYIHLRLYRRGSVGFLCFLLIFAFACLQMCWWGINFLPSAADSVHVY